MLILEGERYLGYGRQTHPTGEESENGYDLFGTCDLLMESFLLGSYDKGASIRSPRIDSDELVKKQRYEGQIRLGRSS